MAFLLARNDVLIILAPMGTCMSAELEAAVSDEGGLGGRCQLNSVESTFLAPLS
jgi:NAD(P)H-dependent flavin oxidoreductase YrpB (nitropropane dioxygenase family)